MMPTVNGIEADAGCYVDGHWGQYGPDHLADQAEAFGWFAVRPTDDPRVLRVFADELSEAGYGDAAGMLWEWSYEAGEEIIAWLNDHTEGDEYLWGRWEGEVFLWDWDQWGLMD